jgi:large subunit ribosomal protein L4e
MTNADLARIINSDEIQSVLNPAKLEAQKRSFPRKKNALKNLGTYLKACNVHFEV